MNYNGLIITLCIILIIIEWLVVIKWKWKALAIAFVINVGVSFLTIEPKYDLIGGFVMAILFTLLLVAPIMVFLEKTGITYCGMA